MSKSSIAAAAWSAGDAFCTVAGTSSEAVLEAYATIVHDAHRRHDADLAAFLHRGAHVSRAQQELRDLIRDLIAEAAEPGGVRRDVALDELATNASTRPARPCATGEPAPVLA